MDSPAERQRRSRAHKRGDHTLCNPARCSQAGLTLPVTPAARDEVTAVLPPRLRARGRRLWRQLVEEADPGPAEIVLIEEACRLADRLDRLDAIVNGVDRAWLTLEVGDDGVSVEVVVDKLLSEARQQQVALKQIVGELRQASSRKPAAARAPGGGLGSGVADLTARIARRGSTAG